MRKDSGIVSGSGRGVIYLVHLRKTAGLQRRQPRPGTALTSCLALKGQQRIKQTENKQRKYDEAANISNNFSVTRRLNRCLFNSLLLIAFTRHAQWSQISNVFVFIQYGTNMNSRYLRIFIFHNNKATPSHLQLMPAPYSGDSLSHNTASI